MKSNVVLPFTDDYKKQCYDAYFLAGRPSDASKILEILPEDEYKRKPSLSVIRRWKKEYNWEWQADEMDAMVRKETDAILIQKKAELLIKQFDSVTRVGEISEEHLLQNGFDSSASAVQAYFKSLEEQRDILGMAGMVKKLSEMDDNQVSNMIFEYITRMSANNQTVEGVIVPAEDTSDAEYEE